MDLETAIQLLSERLDTYYDPQSLIVESLSWFIEDYSRFKYAIVEEIIRRIINPPLLANKTSIQPRLPLFYLIDAVMRRASQIYSVPFGERLPAAYEASLRGNGDSVLIEKLGRLIDHWKQEQYFNDSVLEALQEKFTECTKIQNIPAEPAPPSDESIFIQKQEEENQLPETIQFIPPTIITIQEQKPDEERRLCREWMQSAIDWEAKPYESKPLIRDLDASSTNENKDVQFLILLTPENENVCCAACSGLFDHCIGPSGQECLKDAIYEKGFGYIHQKCKKHLDDDPLSRINFGKNV